MKIHEYQAKRILSHAGIAVPEGDYASTPLEARLIAERLGKTSVVKAQVHAGGRGKAGGVRVVESPAEAEEAAAALIGTNLVTHQTGPQGVPVNGVLVEEAIDIAKELYVSLVVDGAAEGVVAMASEAGGIDIEEVAEKTPDKLLKVAIDPVLGLQPFQGRKLAYGLNVEPELVRTVAGIAGALYRIIEERDSSLIEINPLVITTDGRLLAADAKFGFDDDALFRHDDLQALHDPDQEDPLEAEAGEFGISYVKLDGNVGCIVNGAGLAMATMDVTNAAGAAPANFLDVGGGADEEKVAQALRIVVSDPNVETVLINIFGGILRCDIVARGLVMASESQPDRMLPMVVRMLGTNAEEGRRLLSESSLDVTLVNDLNEAADAIKSAS